MIGLARRDAFATAAASRGIVSQHRRASGQIAIAFARDLAKRAVADFAEATAPSQAAFYLPPAL